MSLSEIRVNTTKTRTGVGTITYTETGPVITGIATASNFKTGSTNVHSTGVELANINTGGSTATFGGAISGTTASFSGTVSIGGTLTYEDVTNIDAVGIITAKAGIHIDDSITHIGDTDTKIRFPGADQIQLDTGGTNYLKLHRYASVNFVEVGSSAVFSLADNGANLRSIMIGDGNASSTGGLWLQPGGGSSGFGASLQLYSHARYPNPGGVWIGTSSGATSQIDFGTSGTYNASAIKMSILSTGRVGVGSTAPEDQFTVHHSNTGNPTGITIRNTNTSNHSHARLKLISQNGAKYTDIWTDVPNDCCRIGYNSSNSLMINNGNAYSKTTVSNWHNDYRVFQAGQASMVGKNPQDGSPAYFSNNAYYDASDSRWEFISTDDACQIEMENGSIKFNNGNTGSANGAITWTTNATFNQSGNLAFGNGKGIDFSATPAPNQGTGSNELFNDYEEGTWTPYYGSSSVPSSTYTDTGGHYTKVGNLVTFTGRIQMSSSTVNGNDLTMGGFPYVCSSGARNGGFYMTYQDNWYSSSSGGTAPITFLLVQGQSYGYFYDGDGTNVNADDCYDGVKRTMHFEGFYYTDA